jgi:iron complex transport system permease protein
VSAAAPAASAPTASAAAGLTVRPALLYGGLGLLCLVGFIASLTVGPSAVSVGAALADLFNGADTTAALIVGEIRLPRALLALGVGAALGMSGAALQGLLRNPLAEPAVIGVSPFAALGAVLAFYSGWANTFPMALPAGGIAGALLAVAALYALAGRSGGVLTLVLAGVALANLASALTSLALSLSPNPFALAEIVFWLLGSLADRSMVHVGLALPFIGAGCLLLATTGRELDALTLGEATARSMGVRLGLLRLKVVAGTALAVGAGVAVSGSIGFVGLIVPHLLRPLAGWSPGGLLFPSALGGAGLLLIADSAVRLPASGAELKLGVLTALIGAPFFLFMVLKSRGLGR